MQLKSILENHLSWLIIKSKNIWLEDSHGKRNERPNFIFQQNPKRKFFGLYFVVDDYESAKEAANLAKYLSGGLAAYGIYLLFPLNEFLYKPDSPESFMSQLGKLVQILLPIWFLLKLNKQRYGVVPWVALISVIEGASWAYQIQPGAGGKIIFILVVLAMSLNAVRGWAARCPAGYLFDL